MGAIWFLFLFCFCFCFVFANFYRLDLHDKARVALANLRCIICEKQVENQTSPDVVMVIGSACMSVDFLSGYIL